MTIQNLEHKSKLRLEQAAKELKLALSEEQKDKLFMYLEQLQKWNKTYNLTAIRDPEQALSHHLFDCLSVIKPLQEHFEKRRNGTPKIMDVGSGGGLPGIVLAIVMPHATVTCVDAVEKKIAFIRQMGGVLKLQNLKALHARVEELKAADVDIVISRAFASLVDFTQLAGKHAAVNGCVLGMKGKDPQEESTALKDLKDWEIEKIETLVVPELHAERCLVWMNRKG
jgi:16S rRNA (guanine527-N7)-methyltransferase